MDSIIILEDIVLRAADNQPCGVLESLQNSENKPGVSTDEKNTSTSVCESISLDDAVFQDLATINMDAFLGLSEKTPNNVNAIRGCEVALSRIDQVLPAVSKQGKIVKRRVTMDTPTTLSKRNRNDIETIEPIIISKPHKMGAYTVKPKKSLSSFGLFLELSEKANIAKQKINDAKKTLTRCLEKEAQIKEKDRSNQLIYQEITMLKVKISQLRKKAEFTKNDMEKDRQSINTQHCQAEKKLREGENSLTEIKEVFNQWSNDMNDVLKKTE